MDFNYGSIIADANNELLLYYTQENDYTGEWLSITYSQKNRQFIIYKDWFGSCSYCDALESSFDYSKEISIEEKKEFAKEYKPFCVIPEEVMRLIILSGDIISCLIPVNLKCECNVEEIISKIVEVLKQENKQ